MFSETKSITEFCVEIGSVNQEGFALYAIRTNKEVGHRSFGKSHIEFQDADKSKAMIAKKLSDEDIRNADALQVSWFEATDSDTVGYMVHGIGVSASYDVEMIVIG
jgi:hypothetical protein